MNKIFALLLTLAMLFSSAACGEGDDDKIPSSNEDKTPGSSQQQQKNTPPPAQRIGYASEEYWVDFDDETGTGEAEFYLTLADE